MPEPLTLEGLLTKLPEGQRTTLDLAGEGPARTVTVELRKLLPEAPRAPRRAESSARHHVFFDAASLAAYLAVYGCPRTVVYADPVAEEISAVLDERAETGFEVVTTKPQVHPLWKPWHDVVGRALSVEDFASHLARHRRAITSPDARELVMTFSQLRAAVNVTVMRGRGRKAVNGVMVETEVKGTRGEEAVDLPDTIVVRAPIYVGLEPAEIPLDLCVEANREGEVYVTLSASTVDAARIAAFEGMLARLRKDLEALGGTFTVGRPVHAAWAYLPEMRPA